MVFRSIYTSRFRVHRGRRFHSMRPIFGLLMIYRPSETSTQHLSAGMSEELRLFSVTREERNGRANATQEHPAVVFVVIWAMTSYSLLLIFLDAGFLSGLTTNMALQRQRQNCGGLRGVVHCWDHGDRCPPGRELSVLQSSSRF